MAKVTMCENGNCSDKDFFFFLAERIVYTPDKAVTMATGLGGRNTGIKLFLLPLRMIDCFEFQILVLLFVPEEKQHLKVDLWGRALDSGHVYVV